MVAAIVACAGSAAGPAWAGDDGSAACLDGKVSAAAAKDAAGFDPTTGRDVRHYPPHKVVDYGHLKLEVMIPDMNTPKLSATETLTVKPIAGPVDELSLDARAMTISSVAAVGHETRFKYDGKAVDITFAPPIAADETVDIVTSYQLDDPPLGLAWTTESPAWLGRAAQIHTQGQPETNSYWFPCHDFPNEKMTTELVATVPAGFLVSSNGRLAEQRHDIIATDSATGVRTLHAYDTFHWVQDKPHVAYLVTMVVGKFDVVDVGTKKLSMPVYAPVGRGKDVPATFGRTKDMVALFERVTGQPYPWDRYAQVLVWNFGSGGMENTSATTLYDTCILEPKALVDHDSEGLISHELAHQWFGDLVTCNSWEHTWLNEGFATYMTALWFEQREDPHDPHDPHGADAYQKYMLGQFASVIDLDRGEAPGDVGMCSKVYAHPWECFRKGASPYSKGSSILHMLRMTLGDEDFFKGVKLYVSRRQFQTAETSDLRTAFEDASGRNLEKFFWQWCTRPGIPRLTIKPVWDAASSTLTVTVEQTQKIDGDNPAFEFDLPVMIAGPAPEVDAAKDAKDGGKSAGKPEPGPRVETIPVAGQSTTWSTRLDSPPQMVAIDPNMSVLAAMEISQPVDRWVAQLSQGPTVYAKVQACRGLKNDSATATAELLRKTAADRKLATPVRIEAVRSLAARGAQMDIRSLATGLPDSWEVREALVGVLPDLIERPELKTNAAVRAGLEEILTVKAQEDKSTKVRCAALRALGRVKPEDASKIVAAALKTDSQSDEIRQAALETLADLDSPKTLQTAMIYAMPGHDTRTRPVAIAAIAKLGHQDKDLALKTLSGYLSDRELRSQQAAGQALVDLKDERALAEFDKAAKAARSDEMKQQIEDWKKALREKLEQKK
jgi:aminopeptidase N